MQPSGHLMRLYRQEPERQGRVMGGADSSAESQFQQTVSSQIALYEADLEGLRVGGGDPDEISAFELIVGELRRLQVEDLAEIARAAMWRTERRPA